MSLEMLDVMERHDGEKEYSPFQTARAVPEPVAIVKIVFWLSVKISPKRLLGLLTVLSTCHQILIALGLRTFPCWQQQAPSWR